MPDLKISALPAGSTLTGSEIYCFVQGGVTVQGTLNDIKAFINGSLGFIPLSGTVSGPPLTNYIEYLQAYGTAIGSSDAFYVGSGNNLDIQNANAYNTILFEAPVAGQYNQIYLNNNQGNWITRKGSTNAIISTLADTVGGYVRLRIFDGTDLGELVLTPQGLTGNSVFTPTQPEDFIQLGYLSGVLKTKVKANPIYAGTPLTLAHAPSFVYSVVCNGLFLQEGDDYTISGTTLTITNPSVSSGDKIYTVYEY